jgi:hypothetical protein
MSDFAESWNLSRGRFEKEVVGLSKAQLDYRIHPNCLTIGEMALHVAGVELMFISQLLGRELEPDAKRIMLTATEGTVNDQPFPFSTEEITPELVAQALALAKSWTEPVITAPAESVRSKQIVSALGPVISGTGALARLAFHPGYHQGQAYLIKTSPGFPRA